MCDALSWGILKRNIAKLTLRKGDRIGPLTDDEIIAKWGDGADFEGRCGHGALAAYYGIDSCDFEHCESSSCIPPECVALANRGAYRRVFKASKGWLSVHYRDDDGHLVAYTERKSLTIAEVASDSDLLARFSKELRRLTPRSLQKALTHALKQLRAKESEHTKHTSNPWEYYADCSARAFVDRLTRYVDHENLPLGVLNDHVENLVQSNDAFDFNYKIVEGEL